MRYTLTPRRGTNRTDEWVRVQAFLVQQDRTGFPTGLGNVTEALGGTRLS